jgi:superfamily II DNA or RNA helicase
VLIADEVGLGKTVQAALAVSELMARGAATRILVLAPAGLREQWAEEFQSRFRMSLALFDMPGVARRRASLPVGINPWSIEPRIVASIDYVKRPAVLPALQACRWDVVVVDEAHHVAVGTDRRDAVSALCASAGYVLLLTATPHDGHSEAFSSLCELGERDDPILVLRRSGSDMGRKERRRIHRLRVHPSAAERHMHACLDGFVRAVKRERGDLDRGSSLGLAVLQKRALSSPFALARTVQRRLSSLQSEPIQVQQLGLPLDDAAGELDPTDAVPAWTIPSLRDVEQERTLLIRLAAAASMALHQESKLAALKRLLRRLHEPALVFTEYRDTLVHLRDSVAPDAAVIHGGLTRAERRAALERFHRGAVLLSTDAAGEGLNLQSACRLVINLELPWNPMRLEQRIGRVDRIGQTRPVHVFHLIANATSEVRLLGRLFARVAAAQAEIGASDPLGMPGSPTDKRPRLTFEPLKHQAQDEHRRLLLARRIAGMGHSPVDWHESDTQRTLVVFSKRQAVRSQIGSRSLVLLRSCLCDNTGRVAATHVTPVLIRAARVSLDMLARLDVRDEAMLADRRYAGWLALSIAAHEAFWTARLRRERAIALALRQDEPREIQPGLFDRRADRARLLDLELQQARQFQHDENLARIGRSLRLTLQPPVPALMLVP